MCETKEINQRIRELRNKLNLSQTEFAKKLGITQKAISKIEQFESNVSNRTFWQICKEFGVNEKWLRNGEGEVRVSSNESIIDEVARHFDLGEESRNLLKMFLEFDKNQQEIIIKFVNCLSENWRNVHKEKSSLQTTEDIQTMSASEIDQQVAEYRLELEVQNIMSKPEEERTDEEIGKISY